MPRFRKKPVVVEARRWEGGAAAATPIIDWILEGGDRSARYHEESPGQAEHIAIDTLKGTHAASVGDWVIRGVAGEHYPCRADIFEATYEPVEAE